MLLTKALLPIFLSNGVAGFAVTPSRTDIVGLLNRDTLSPSRLLHPRSASESTSIFSRPTDKQQVERRSTNIKEKAAKVQSLLDKKADILFGDSGMRLGLSIIEEIGDTPDKYRLAVLTDIQRTLYDALVVAHRRQEGLSTSDSILTALFERFDDEASRRFNKGKPLPTNLQMWQRIASAREEARKMWNSDITPLREGLMRPV